MQDLRLGESRKISCWTGLRFKNDPHENSSENAFEGLRTDNGRFAIYAFAMLTRYFVIHAVRLYGLLADH